MKRRLFDILACPVCGGEVSLTVLREDEAPAFRPEVVPCQRRCLWKEDKCGGKGIEQKTGIEDCGRCHAREIVEGSISCPQGHNFSISRGLLRALSLKKEKTRAGAGEAEFHNLLGQHGKVKATFDREWRMVDAEKEIYGHSPEEEEEDFFRRMCVDEKFLKGKLVLDVGCGIGRLADRLSQRNAEVVGVELSSGVEKAWGLVGNNPRVHFIQGNLFSLPFRPRVFDYVYSKGVLQYVSDPREAFRQMSRFVRPGGGLSVTLYPPLPRFFSLLNQGVRAMTLRFPLGLVHSLSLIAVPFLSPAWKISGVKERRIPWRDRGHMIFNWLASDYQNFHSTEEVVSWYREEGFADIRSSPLPVGVFGRWEGRER